MVEIRKKFEVTIKYDGDTGRDEFWMNSDNLQLVLTNSDYKLNRKMIESIHELPCGPIIKTKTLGGTPL